MALTVAELRAVFTADDRQFLASLGRMNAAGASMQKAGARVTRGLTLPLLGAGAAAFKMGSDYEKSMSMITGLVGISEKQVSRWSKQVLELSKTLPQSPKELADALFFVTSAGFKGKEAMDVLTASARAAAAGLGDTTSVADAVTSAVNAYGIENLSASKATDILTAAVREGKLEASTLAPVLGRVIPLASELGVGFSDVAASLAAMSRTGMEANEGAAATSAILRQLIQESPMGVKALKGVGLSYDDVRRSLREKGLIQTLMDLRDAFDGNLPKMRAVFQDANAMTGVLALTGTQADTNVGIFKRLSEATGDTDKAFAAAAETSDFQWKAALNSLKAALIEVGDAIGPFVVDLANGIAGITQKFSDLNPKQQEWVLIVAAAAAALGPLLYVLGTVLRTFALLTTAITTATRILGLNTAAVALSHTTLGTWLGVKALELTAWVRTTAAAVAHRVASIAGTAATKAMTAAQLLLNAALRANPIGIVITLLAALAAGVIYAYKHSKTFREVVDAAFRAVAEAGKWMWENVLKPVFGFLVDAFQAGRQAATAMREGISTAWSLIEEATRVAVLWMVDKMAWWAEKVVGTVARAFGWAPVIGDKLRAAHEKVQRFRDRVNKELDGIQDEEVRVSLIADLSRQDQNRATFAPPPGSKGGSGGGTGGPNFRAEVPDAKAIGKATREEVQALAKVLASDMAERMASLMPFAGGGKGSILPPGSYTIGMPYLGYSGHYGADYPAPAGTPVRSMAAGYVSRALSLTTSYGKHVFVEHPGGIQTRYAHLSGIAVVAGQQVGAGQLLGWVGSTGKSTGDHLHFEYRVNGVPRDPNTLGLFDTGGWLVPGVAPVNKLSRPEAVLTPDESAAFVRIARQLTREGVGEAPAPDLSVLAAEVRVLGDRFEAALRDQTDRETLLRRTGAMR